MAQEPTGTAQASFVLESPLPTAADLEAAWVGRCGEQEILLIASADTLYRSSDLGHSFERVASFETAAWEQLIGIGDGRLAIAGEDVALSDDCGQSWNLVERLDGVTGSPGWSPNGELLLYAPEGGRSGADAGATPSIFAQEFDADAGDEVVLLDQNLAFAVGRAGLWETRDGGQSWRQIRLSQGLQSLKAIAFSPNHELGLVAGYGGIYTTADHGETWQLVAINERSLFVDVAAPSPDRLYALTANGSLWTSADRGESFELKELPGGEVEAMAFATELRGYVVGHAGSLWMSEDGGESWQQLRQGVGESLEAIVTLYSSGEKREMALGHLGAAMLAGTGQAWEPLELGSHHSIYEAVPYKKGVIALGSDRLIKLKMNEEGTIEYQSLDFEGADVRSELALWEEQVYALVEGQLSVLGEERFGPVKVSPLGDLVGPLSGGDQGLLVGGAKALWLSQDGRTWTQFGPPNLILGALVQDQEGSVYGLDRAGALLRIDAASATLIALPDDYSIETAQFDAAGGLWFGGPFGMLFYWSQPNAPILARTLPTDSPIVALACADQCAALAGDGQLFVEEAEQQWTSFRVWQRAVDAGFEAENAALGALSPCGDGWLIAGPDGLAWRFEAGQLQELKVEMATDLYAAACFGDALAVGGDGRTLFASNLVERDRLELYSDDLSPEILTSLILEGRDRGLGLTSRGSVLSFDERGAEFEVVAKFTPPLTELVTCEGSYYFGDAQGHVQGAQDGVSFSHLWHATGGEPISALAVQSAQDFGYAAGGQLVWVQGLEQWQSEVSSHGQGLFEAEEGSLMRADDGSIWRIRGNTLSTPQVLPLLSTIRAARWRDNGWTMVGAGGLILHLEDW